MIDFLAWDPLNGTAAEGTHVEAHTPMEAAEEFARQDTDGQTDGMYDGGGDDVDVEDPDGRIWRYTIAWVGHPKCWQERACEGAKLRAVTFAGERDGAGGAL